MYFSIRVTSLKSYSIKDLVSPILVRVYYKYFNTEIVEYSTIMSSQIGYDKNSLKNSRNHKKRKKERD